MTISSAHVAIVVFPMASHSATLFTVARALALAAPSVAFSFVCTSDSITSLSLSLSLSSSPISNLKLCEGLKIPDGDLGVFFRSIPGNLREGIAAAEEQEGGARVTCVVSDGLMPAAGDVAAEMGVPWVPVRFCGPAMALAQLYCEQIRESFKGEEGEKLIGITPSLHPLRFKDMPDFILAGNADPLNAGIIKTYPHAAAVVFNTFEGLDPLIDIEFNSKFMSYFPIGPTVNLVASSNPSLPHNDRCIEWLDSQRDATAVYVSFGTFNSPSKDELVELSEALMATGVPFVWSLKENEKEGLPHSFFQHVDQGKGMMVKWAPQVQVLAHRAVGAFITHGGWNSVMESISSGVPMICRPFRWDQMTNARMVSCVYGTGVTVDEKGMKKEEMMRTLKSLLEEEEGRKMREKANKLKEMAEAAVRDGGSSIQNLNKLVEILCGRS